MSRAEAFCHAIDIVNQRVGRAFSYVVLPLLVIVIMEVILRRFFNRPTIWGWDVNIQLLSAITVMGAGYTLFAQGHVVIDIFVGRLSRRKRAILDMVTALLFFFCIGALVYQGSVSGWYSVTTREHYTSVWNPPIYFLKMLIPVGVTLLFLQGVVKFIRDFNVALHPEQQGEPK